MGNKIISWLRSRNSRQMRLLLAAVAWLGIVVTMSVMAQSLKVGLGSGAVFLVPLALAVKVAHGCLIEPARKKLAVEGNWSHPQTAAMTAGIFISFLTTILMMILVMIGVGIWEAIQSMEGLSRIVDPTRLATNILMVFYVTGVGLVAGSWVWIPVGAGLGCWLKQKASH